MTAVAPAPGEVSTRGLDLWNAIVVLSTATLAVLVPLDLVLGVSQTTTVRWLRALFTLIFLLDIPLRVRLAGSARRGPVTAWRFRSRDMLRVPLDVIAAVPWSVLTGMPASDLLRLVKLERVRAVLAEWRVRELRWADALLLVYTVFWISLATHWITCGWIALRGIAPGVHSPAAYVDALYWTMSTITTVGYGDVVPANITQKLYAIGTMALGVGFFGYVVGFVAGLWTRRDPARLRFQENIEKLATATKYARLPRSLQRRIYDYHYHVWKQRLGYDEFDFLSALPKNLRAEVSLHLKRDLLAEGDLFRGADPDFVKEIALHLRPLVLTPGDVVFEEGDEGRDMYFIARGQLEVVSRDGRRLALMEPGDFFGEIALLRQAPRSATVRAVQYADVYSLSRTAFENVVARYPEVLRRLEAAAQSRSGNTSDPAI